MRSALGEDDTVLPIVPMFHVNAWGLPFSAHDVRRQPGVSRARISIPQSVLELLVVGARDRDGRRADGVAGVLQELDKNPGKYDLSALRAIVVGGSAAPPAMIRGVRGAPRPQVLHAWGMTEMTPLGTLCNLPSALAERAARRSSCATARAGHAAAARRDPRARRRRPRALGRQDDGRARGARAVGRVAVLQRRRAPTIAFTDDGWFRTGDIVTIAERGCIELTDRAKDLVKSGGEWISSVALETALMGHPAVAEAAVIAVPHPKWDERPLAVVVLKPGQTATADELLAFLAPNFAKWWLPDAIEFVAEIPRTSVGKFKKSVLREQFKDSYQQAED